jgi:hypothetical protein
MWDRGTARADPFALDQHFTGRHDTATRDIEQASGMQDDWRWR